MFSLPDDFEMTPLHQIAFMLLMVAHDYSVRAGKTFYLLPNVPIEAAVDGEALGAIRIPDVVFADFWELGLLRRCQFPEGNWGYCLNDVSKAS